MSNNENKEQTITKKDLKKSLNRYIWMRQAPFNYETMQSGGWVYAMHPCMKKLYTDEELKKKYKSYFRFYNTHPWMGNLLLGAALAVESTKDENATETAVDMRTALMGPLAGLGDSLIWILPMTIFGAIAAYSALNGSITGFFIAEAVLLAIWFLFYKLFFVAYDKGVTFVTEKNSQLNNLTTAASVLGLAVVGALVVSTVNVKFGIQFNIGDVSQSLNDLLNTIIPYFANVLTVFLIYLGLGKKGMTSTRMVILLIVVGIILGATGILA